MEQAGQAQTLLPYQGLHFLAEQQAEKAKMMNDTGSEFDSVRNIVVKVLMEDVRARSDDKWLCYKVISKFTKIFIPYQDFHKFPSFETITRCRRKIQNDEGLYRPKTEVVENRQERERDIREWVKT